MNRRFTEKAQKVLVLAQDEAKKMGHQVVGTEHLLLGLIQEGEGIAAKALIASGLDLEKI
ncbi:MAG: Clp protease N-terminal domain-containing protein, partial [Desulfitobacteriaceae bacterium]